LEGKVLRGLYGWGGGFWEGKRGDDGERKPEALGEWATKGTGGKGSPGDKSCETGPKQVRGKFWDWEAAGRKKVGLEKKVWGGKLSGYLSN